MKKMVIPKILNPETFVQNIDVRAENECWNWKGEKTPKGYGRFYYKGRQYFSHRISKMVFENVELDRSKVIDHICRNKLCQNPKHLREVPARINVLENSISNAAINSQKAYCKNGHEFNDTNTAVTKRADRNPDAKRRYCKECKRIANLRYRGLHE